MGMSFSNVENRFRKGIQNLDDSRFRLYNLHHQCGVAVVCIDNQLYSYRFATTIKDINLAIYRCNLAFNEDRWPDTLFFAYYDKDGKFLEKKSFKTYKQSNDYLDTMNSVLGYTNKNKQEELSEQDWMKL